MNEQPATQSDTRKRVQLRRQFARETPQCIDKKIHHPRLQGLALFGSRAEPVGPLRGSWVRRPRHRQNRYRNFTAPPAKDPQKALDHLMEISIFGISVIDRWNPGPPGPLVAPISAAGRYTTTPLPGSARPGPSPAGAPPPARPAATPRRATPLPPCVCPHRSKAPASRGTPAARSGSG